MPMHPILLGILLFLGFVLGQFLLSALFTYLSVAVYEGLAGRKLSDQRKRQVFYLAFLGVLLWLSAICIAATR